MKLDVYTHEGNKTGRMCAIPTPLRVEVNPHVLYLDIKRQRAAKRTHTHSTKMRAEVEASGRKIKRQKGSGTARAGALTSPIFRGGGTTFGPRPGGRSLRLSRKTKTLARRAAFAQKCKEKALTLVEDFTFDAPKTKKYIQFLAHFSLQNKRSLLVLDAPNPSVYLSSRNVQGARVVLAQELNTYDILHCEHLVVSEKGLANLSERWTSKTK